MKRYIVANWKMNPATQAAARRIFDSIKRTMPRIKKRTRVVICPSHVHLSYITRRYRGRTISFGAQDCSEFPEGSHTGENSINQLRDLDTEYVILGHSERRELGEDNARIRAKVQHALALGMRTILCVGESVRDQEGEYLSFIAREIESALHATPERRVSRLVIAYEPVWAIGRGAEDAMTPHELHQMTLFIRKTLTKLFGKKRAQRIPVLYGGSVEENNVLMLMRDGNVDGFLVGHASLEPKQFSSIIKVVDTV